MDTDARPAKRTKVDHEGGAPPAAAATTTTTGDHRAHPGAQTSAAAPAESLQADAPPAEKFPREPLTSAAATHTAASPDAAGSPREARESVPPTSTAAAPSDGQQPLSKNAQKRLRRQAEWDAKKADRKEWRREKNQVKKERKREARAANGGVDPEAFKQKQRAHVRATQLPVTFVIDCDFDDKMRDNERISLAGQITRAYSDNKNAPFRAHLAVCSFGGKLRERFDTVLHQNYTHWKGTRFLDDDFVAASEKAKEWMADEKKGGKLAAVFKAHAPQQPVAAATDAADPSTEAGAEPEASGDTARDGTTTATDDLRSQGEVIYLSSDSPHTLTTLKPYSTYIIGGLVDKNREKGICAARAAAKGVKTARLPIGDYLDMTSRKVLATNHVNEIMLRWLELGDWAEAFMKVIPKRKGGRLRGEKDRDGDEEEEDEDEDDDDDGYGQQDGEGEEEKVEADEAADEEHGTEAETETVKAEVEAEAKTEANADAHEHQKAREHV